MNVIKLRSKLPLFVRDFISVIVYPTFVVYINRWSLPIMLVQWGLTFGDYCYKGFVPEAKSPQPWPRDLDNLARPPYYIAALVHE
jgi:hypothetical protein